MANEPTTTEIEDFLSELGGGVFREHIGRALSDTAFGVMQTGKGGKVVLTFDMKPLGNSETMINVGHKIRKEEPHRTGKMVDESTTSTPMHVGRGGKMTFFPDTQEAFDFVGRKETTT